MTNNLPTPASICFIGSNSLFSLIAFKTLRERKINVTQVILAGHAPAPARKTVLPVSMTDNPAQPITSIQQLASLLHIPVTFLGYTENRTQQWQRLCNDDRHHPVPDFVFVACFPEKLPADVIQWPRKKCINLHPSLLPEYRGPNPLFWQLRMNETHTGISLHLLNEELDTGPILRQQEITFPLGASHEELTTLLAVHGAHMFADLVCSNAFKAKQQNTSQASYQPLPTSNDYCIDQHWSAEHAYRFIMGTRTPVNGYPIRLNNTTLHLTTALSFENKRELPEDFKIQNNVVQIRFSDGVLCAKSV